MEMVPYNFTAGRMPLLVSMPHVGTHIPQGLASRMTAAARAVPDTDWHVDRLYDFLEGLCASVIAATHSRLVIDLNRDPGGTPLYPGASNTELCPLTLFDNSPVYLAGQEPSQTEIAGRIEEHWRPYHERLSIEMHAMKAEHGIAVLFDAHSIRSRVPRFFDGRLPDINLGTGGGASADPALAAAALEAAADADGYTSVLNGRFKGGYITRTYGRPRDDMHAIQLELAQITYMDEAPPFGFREDLAKQVRPALAGIVGAILDWAKGAAQERAG
jgi:N-formylglutamate deformylase